MNNASEAPIAAITGANGYVGTIVAEALMAAGFEVRRLVRRPRPETTDHGYEISAGCSPDALKGVDLLIHCAYNFSATSRSEVWAANVYGTRSLMDLAVSTGVRRTIFVSSMSAYPGTRQIYGRGKLASELDAFARGMSGNSSRTDLWAWLGRHGRSTEKAYVASARAPRGPRCPPVHPSRG